MDDRRLRERLPDYAGDESAFVVADRAAMGIAAPAPAGERSALAQEEHDG